MSEATENKKGRVGGKRKVDFVRLMSTFKVDARPLWSTKTQSHWICSEVCNTPQLAHQLFTAYTSLILLQIVYFDTALPFFYCFSEYLLATHNAILRI